MSRRYVRKTSSPETGFAVAAVVVWLLWAAVVLAFWGAVIYVVLHFIAKVW